MNRIKGGNDGLRFYLLGDVHIEKEHSFETFSLPRPVQCLLGYLLVYRDRFHSREALENRLWDDEDIVRSRACLSTALWRLRRVIEHDRHRGMYVTQTAQTDIKFNTTSHYSLDVEILESKISRIVATPVDKLTEAEVSESEDALALYRGDLLEGHCGDWVIGERERLRALYLDSLAVAMEYRASRGDYARALAHGHKALQIEPLREDIHRTVMQVYAMSGRIAQALRQFSVCRDLLRKELGIAPMRATLALHEEIAQQVAIPRNPAMSPPLRPARGTSQPHRQQAR